jgi:hypothetical protein
MHDHGSEGSLHPQSPAPLPLSVAEGCRLMGIAEVAGLMSRVGTLSRKMRMVVSRSAADSTRIRLRETSWRFVNPKR